MVRVAHVDHPILQEPLVHGRLLDDHMARIGIKDHASQGLAKPRIFEILDKFRDFALREKSEAGILAPENLDHFRRLILPGGQSVHGLEDSLKIRKHLIAHIGLIDVNPAM